MSSHATFYDTDLEATMKMKINKLVQQFLIKYNTKGFSPDFHSKLIPARNWRVANLSARKVCFSSFNFPISIGYSPLILFV